MRTQVRILPPQPDPSAGKPCRIEAASAGTTQHWASMSIMRRGRLLLHSLPGTQTEAALLCGKCKELCARLSPPSTAQESVDGDTVPPSLPLAGSHRPHRGVAPHPLHETTGFVMTERKSWRCTGCGKVHAPHVDTCPEQVAVAPHLPGLPDTTPIRPATGPLYPFWPYEVTCLATTGGIINDHPTAGLTIWN